MYLCGEVHAVTVIKDTDSDILQIVHGDPPMSASPEGPMSGNYAVFEVQPQSIDVTLYAFDLQEDGNSKYWQASKPLTSGPSSAMMHNQPSGVLNVDVRRSATRFSASGDLQILDQTGLVMHFGFDQTTASGHFSNSGGIGNDWYEGVAQGRLNTAPGKFGSSASLNGIDAFVESGRGNLTEGEDRTVSAWVRTGSGRTQVVLSYGADAFGDARSEVNGRFNFRLNDGRPQVNISPTKTCTASGAPRVDDDSWHHLAVVLREKHDDRCGTCVSMWTVGNSAPHRPTLRHRYTRCRSATSVSESTIAADPGFSSGTSMTWPSGPCRCHRQRLVHWLTQATIPALATTP
jgi:hypothetical protein